MFENGINGAKDVLGLIDKAWCWMNNSKEKLLRSLVPRVPSWVTPNMISWSRIVSAVLIAGMLFRYEDFRGWIVGLFLVAIIGDIFDGPLARVRKEETPTGAVLDRLGDKLLVCSMILRLLLMYHPILVVIMIVVEFGALLVMRGKTSEWLAKYKMAAEAIGILILLLLPLRITWAFGAFVSSLVLGTMSCINGIRSRTA